MLGSEEVIKMDACLSCSYYHPLAPTKETLKWKALFYFVVAVLNDDMLLRRTEV